MRVAAVIKNAHGQAVDRIGGAIVAGRYAVGATLPAEPLLCDELGVSRTVVREAVKSLAAKGLLVAGPKVGTRVLPAENWNWFDPDVVAWQTGAGLTRDFLRDLQELRRVIEPAAVRMAAERATAQDIAEIEAAYAGMKHAVEQGGDYVANDLRFHQGLLRAGGNRMMVQMSKAIGALLRTSFEVSTTLLDGPGVVAAAASRGARCGDRAQARAGRTREPQADRQRGRRHRAGARLGAQAAVAAPGRGDRQTRCQPGARSRRGAATSQQGLDPRPDPA